MYWKNCTIAFTVSSFPCSLFYLKLFSCVSFVIVQHCKWWNAFTENIYKILNKLAISVFCTIWCPLFISHRLFSCVWFKKIVIRIIRLWWECDWVHVHQLYLHGITISSCVTNEHTHTLFSTHMSHHVCQKTRRIHIGTKGWCSAELSSTAASEEKISPPKKISTTWHEIHHATSRIRALQPHNDQAYGALCWAYWDSEDWMNDLAANVGK